MFHRSIHPSALMCFLVAGAAGAHARAPQSPKIQPTVAGLSGLHIFPEPLTPVGGQPREDENRALAEAIEKYQAQGLTEAVEPLTAFLSTYPSSPWRAAVWTNVGLAYHHTGHYSKALWVWEQAWTIAQGATAPAERAIGDRAFGEMLELNARLGRMERVRLLLEESRGRKLLGSTSEKAERAKELLRHMEQDPAHAFRCGPQALSLLRQSMGLGYSGQVEAFTSFREGTSLQQNQRWASDLGMDFQMAYRPAGTEVVVPSLVHWKAGHYAALVARDGDRYVLKDPTFNGELRVSRAALDDEATGYCLIPKGSLPQGWWAVSDEEGREVWGKGEDNPIPEGPFCPPVAMDCHGMPVDGYFNAQTALGLVDIPLSYRSPRGPKVEFTLTYFQRNIHQAQGMRISNLGYKWAFGWGGYIQDDPALPRTVVNLYNWMGGWHSFGWDGIRQCYRDDSTSGDQLAFVNQNSYVRTMADGSKEIYGLSDGAATAPRRFYLTQKVDPQGNAVTFGYDAQLRLTTVTDAAAQVTTLSYEAPGDPYKITKVTDPFGRYAAMTYTPDGLLASVRDQLGLISSFSYGPTAQSPNAPGDFVNAMQTPYGTTTFRTGTGPQFNQWVETEDPMGNRKRLEFSNYGAVPFSEPYTPTGAFCNQFLNYRNVYYWDKRAMASGFGDFNTAEVTHYLRTVDNTGWCSTPASIKKPLERRAWFRYPAPDLTFSGGPSSGLNNCGASSGGVAARSVSYGTSSAHGSGGGALGGYVIPPKKQYDFNKPIQITRVLDDGTQQDSNYTYYNDFSKTTSLKDPSGRAFSLRYSPDGIDLIGIYSGTAYSWNAGAFDVTFAPASNNLLLAKFTYNTQHEPLTITDASGQVTTYTYNSWGQLLSVTDPKGAKTSVIRDAQGRVLEVDGALAGLKNIFTYDAVGRVRTATTPDGDAMTFDYDAMDRVTKLTYPDGSTEERRYDRLDLAAVKDRLGKWSYMAYNPLRQLMEVQDAEGRVTRLSWCGCGAQLESLTDPQGRITSWVHDLQGRVVNKIYPDLKSDAYAYDSIGRLSTRTDARGQTTNYAYYLDNNLKNVTYANAKVATPGVSYTYDADFNRLHSMTDGFGTTTATYNPIAAGLLGAGRMATLSTTFPPSTLAFGYDELGRVIKESVDGKDETISFDAGGRVQGVTNLLGAFSFDYDGATSRLKQAYLPNGQVTAFDYFDGLGNRRLKQISNSTSMGANISAFGYTYDANGQIQTWSQQADAQTPKVYSFGYDAIGELLSATLSSGDPTGAVLKQFTYGYDDGGNRTNEQIDGSVVTSTFNALNQMLVQRSSTISAPAQAPALPAAMKGSPSSASTPRSSTPPQR